MMISARMTAKSRAHPHWLMSISICLIGQQAGASAVHLQGQCAAALALARNLQPIWPDASRLTSENTRALAEGFLSDLHKTQLNKRGDTDFAYANEFGRYRTSVVRQRHRDGHRFRIINTKVRTMDELGLPRASQIAHALSEWIDFGDRFGRQRQIDHTSQP